MPHFPSTCRTTRMTAAGGSGGSGVRAGPSAGKPPPAVVELSCREYRLVSGQAGRCGVAAHVAAAVDAAAGALAVFVLLDGGAGGGAGGGNGSDASGAGPGGSFLARSVIHWALVNTAASAAAELWQPPARAAADPAWPALLWEDESGWRDGGAEGAAGASGAPPPGGGKCRLGSALACRTREVPGAPAVQTDFVFVEGRQLGAAGLPPTLEKRAREAGRGCYVAKIVFHAGDAGAGAGGGTAADGGESCPSAAADSVASLLNKVHRRVSTCAIEFVLLLGNNEWHREGGERNFRVDLGAQVQRWVRENELALRAQHVACAAENLPLLGPAQRVRYDVPAGGGTTFPLLVVVAAVAGGAGGSIAGGGEAGGSNAGGVCEEVVDGGESVAGGAAAIADGAAAVGGCAAAAGAAAGGDAALVFDFFTDFSHPLVLHWGLQPTAASEWEAADPRFFAAETPTHPFSATASQTEFAFVAETEGLQHARLRLWGVNAQPHLSFVLKEARANTWFKDGGAADFRLDAPAREFFDARRDEARRVVAEAEERERRAADARAALFADALAAFVAGRPARAAEADFCFRTDFLSDDGGAVDVLGKIVDGLAAGGKGFAAGGGAGGGKSFAAGGGAGGGKENSAAIGDAAAGGAAGEGVAAGDENAPPTPAYDLTLLVTVVGCFRRPPVLHWGVLRTAGKRQRFAQHEWECPEAHMRPTGTVVVDARACETLMRGVGDGEGVGAGSNVGGGGRSAFGAGSAVGGAESAADGAKGAIAGFGNAGDGGAAADAGVSGAGAAAASAFTYALSFPIRARRDAQKSEAHTALALEVAGLAFVFRDGSSWYKAPDLADFRVPLLTAAAGSGWEGPILEIPEKILEAEIGWNQMTLMHRFNLVNSSVESWRKGLSAASAAGGAAGGKAGGTAGGEAGGAAGGGIDVYAAGSAADGGTPHFYRSFTSLFRADSRSAMLQATLAATPSPPDGGLAARTSSDSREFWAWVFVWLRLSYLGQLDWQRNYNTKPRDLAHSAESLASRLGSAYRAFPDLRPVIRLALSTVGRGGGGGQRIRDQILEIMHRHKIPEAAGNFYEQWHQKLHNNTTPDDIAICRAVIAYLGSGGDLGKYWAVLADHGVTRARLASYERKITADPYVVRCDVSALVSDLWAYHDVLVDVHDAVDLRKAFQHARVHLAGDACAAVDAAVAASGPRTGVQLRGGGDAAAAAAAAGGAGGLSPDAVHARFSALSHARRAVLTRLSAADTLPDIAVRDLLFLDFALEQQQLVALQAPAAPAASTPQLADQLAQLALHLAAHHPTSESLARCSKDWQRLAAAAAADAWRWGPEEAALLLNALADRLGRLVGNMVEDWQTAFGPKALFLGAEIGIDPRVTGNFVDEVLRGSGLFGISLVLKRLEPRIREAAKLPPWQIIAPPPPGDGKVRGRVQVVPELYNIQMQTFAVPTVLVSGAVSGEEEIPAGVQAVLIRSARDSPDILSHAAVRARNAHVLMAVCFDEPAVFPEKRLAELDGRWVRIEVQPNGAALKIDFEEEPEGVGAAAAGPAAAGPAVSSAAEKSAAAPTDSKHAENVPALPSAVSSKRPPAFNRQLTQQSLSQFEILRTSSRAKLSAPPATIDLATESTDWVVAPAAFSRETVGSKSRNLAQLRPLLPEAVLVPDALALPYGSFQKALGAAPAARAELGRLAAEVAALDDVAAIEARFAEARAVIAGLEMPAAMREALRAAAADPGADLNDFFRGRLERGDPGFAAIKAVWASVFAVRPWVSLQKAGKRFADLCMAVLIQELLPAQYAFVLHSRNPFDATAPDEMYGELVVGLGEFLVNNSPGRALSWRMKKYGEPKLMSFPSKDKALVAERCLIFRSDSNGEDLDGFAGAGLFESVTELPGRVTPLTYAYVRLVTDRQYRQRLLREVGNLAFAVEAHLGFPADVEGCVLCPAGPDDAKFRLAVVQARPQV